MVIKLLLVIGVVVAYILYFCRSNYLRQTYFFAAVVLSVIREIDVPELGNIVPSVVMFWTMFIDLMIRNIGALRKWLWYIGMLLVSLVMGLYQFEPDRVLRWENPLWVVMICALLTPAMVRNEESLQRFIRCILAAAFIFSFSAIISYWGFYDGTVLLNMDNDGLMTSSRIYGISYSNLVQTISVICICLIPFAGIKKIWSYLLVIVFAYGALITLKRMSLIALCISLAYYCYCAFRQHDRWVILVVAMIIVGIFQVDLVDKTMQRFEIYGANSTQIVDHSALSRVMRMEYALSVFEKNPILGGGAGSAPFVHNGFMEILANCGIVGLITIFLRYLVPLKGLPKANPWSVAVLVFVASVLSLESGMSRPELMVFLGLFMGGYSASRNLGINYSSLLKTRSRSILSPSLT